MACPYFYPSDPVPGASAAPARAPLGRLYQGECRASATAFCPRGQLTELCNFGYARGKCECFPEKAPADCVRLTIQTSGKVIYILEHRYTPIEHGDASLATPIIRRQAEALRESLA